jgi:hypothetical protein
MNPCVSHHVNIARIVINAEKRAVMKVVAELSRVVMKGVAGMSLVVTKVAVTSVAIRVEIVASKGEKKEIDFIEFFQ